MQTPTRAGWFDDPENDQQLRYFDGVIWTKHTTPRSTRQAAPGSVQAGQQQFPGQGHPPQYPGQGGPVQQAPTQPGQSSQPTAPPAAGQPAGWQAPNPQFPGTPQSGQWSSPPQEQQHPGQYPGQQGQYPGQYPGHPGQYPGQPGPWNTPGYGGFVVGPSTPDGQPLASYGRRLVAFLIDWVIQSVIGAVLGYAFLSRAFSGYLDQVDQFARDAERGQQPDFAALSNSIDLGALLAFTLLAALVFVLYQVFFLSRLGATPGKLLLGISVRQRSQPGPMPMRVVLRRVGFAAVLFVLQPVPFLGLLAFLARLLDLAWPAWDDHRQALHDRVAATNVVRGRQQR